MDKVVVSFDKVTFGDVEKLQKREFGDDITAMLDLLDKFVVGDVREVPLNKMDELVEAIESAMKAETSGN